MNKTEILNIVNEPSKHIQIVKTDGKDSIVYSSKFVELLELIPTMSTKADMVAMLTEIQEDIEEVAKCPYEQCIGAECSFQDCMIHKGRVVGLIQEKIDKLKGVKDADSNYNRR